MLPISHGVVWLNGSLALLARGRYARRQGFLILTMIFIDAVLI
jgi:hypothetical protein